MTRSPGSITTAEDTGKDAAEHGVSQVPVPVMSGEVSIREHSPSPSTTPLANVLRSHDTREHENDPIRRELRELRAAKDKAEARCRHLEEQNSLMQTHLDDCNLKLRTYTDDISTLEEQVHLSRSEGTTLVNQKLRDLEKQLLEQTQQATRNENASQARNESLIKHAAALQTRIAQLTKLPVLTPLPRTFPFQFENTTLHAQWYWHVEELAGILRPRDGYVPSHALFAKEDVPPLLQRELRTITGLSDEETTGKDLADYFPQATHLPYDHNIVVTCLMSRVHRWCFETNFHTSGLESQKLHEVWTAIARDGMHMDDHSKDND